MNGSTTFLGRVTAISILFDVYAPFGASSQRPYVGGFDEGDTRHNNDATGG
jgi:hypothetical protein